MEKELKTATIYTVLGNQVLVSTDKQINVSSLSSGNYFVRIEAVDGAVTTQKIIIKKKTFFQNKMFVVFFQIRWLF